MSSESSILREFAAALAQRLSREAIRRLQQLKNSTLSPEDSGLKNPWDEICVQVQSEYSVTWHAYRDTARGILHSLLPTLQDHELKALWLQTEAGFEWIEEDGPRSMHAEEKAEVVDYLFNELLSRAEDWSNERIRAFLGE